MMPKAQITKKVVQDEIDRDLLGTKKSKWNGSVNLPTSNRVEDMGGNFHKDLHQGHQNFLIRHGFADETITRADP